MNKRIMAGMLGVFSVSGGALAQPTTTLITHGVTLGSKGLWVQNMAAAVRVNGVTGGSVYRYDGATGKWRFLPAISDGSTDTVALIFNWVDESDGVGVGANWGYAQAASDALVAALREAQYLDGAGPGDLVTGRTLHLIGHSRGATVMSEAAKRLVLDGITVDHLTTLDPHPVNGITTGCLGVGDDDWNDPDPQRWSRTDGCAEVTFADNYFRFDGNGCDPDGQPVDNVHNVPLVDVLGDNDFIDNDLFGACPLEHIKVHTFYHGTVDLGAGGDGDGCGIDNNWYTPTGGPGCTSRACNGFFFSALGGGVSMRPAMGAGAEPTPAPILCNGGFDLGSYAGWSFHGGGGSGSIDAAGYLALGASGGAMTHNRFFLPTAAQSLTYQHRINSASPDDELVVVVTGLMTVAVTELERFALSAASAGFVTRTMPLPASLTSGAYTLTVSIDGGITGVESQVDLDNIDITAIDPGCAPCPGDLNGDGVVDTADLGVLISAFGSSDPIADINTDGVVDTADLGILISAFGVNCGA